jgi:hypothetical protein
MVDKGFTEKRVRDGIYDLILLREVCAAASQAKAHRMLR